jgi:hypothetical protein
VKQKGGPIKSNDVALLEVSLHCCPGDIIIEVALLEA